MSQGQESKPSMQAALAKFQHLNVIKYVIQFHINNRLDGGNNRVTR